MAGGEEGDDHITALPIIALRGNSLIPLKKNGAEDPRTAIGITILNTVRVEL